MELTDITKKLERLTDDNPNQAIKEALQLSGDIYLELLKAATLVNAGEIVKNSDAIRTGVEIYRNAVVKYQDNPALKYNLANGLHALVRSTKDDDTSWSTWFQWHQETEDSRLEARQYLYVAANAAHASLDIRTQSFTNLGKILKLSHRWVEAYDFYTLALKENPRNGVASHGALEILRGALHQGLGDHELLAEEMRYLKKHVSKNMETTQAYVGAYGLKCIVDQIKDIHIGDQKRPVNECGGYESFVVSNNLTLSLTIHSHKHDPKFWDTINILSVTSGANGNRSVPEIFAMINILKSDYILARQIFFDASKRLFNETGNYNDTLDYACYGINESALALAQRSALDILDKVAVATLAYLGVYEAKKTSFKQAWFEKSTKKYKPEILQEINDGNTALLALTEIAIDLSINKGGFLSEKQTSRNSSTHRFTVFHDLGKIPTSKSGCLEHFDYEIFLKEALYTLKLARSSVIYFVQMVLIQEKKHLTEKDKQNIFLTELTVPSYEDIHRYNE